MVCLAPALCRVAAILTANFQALQGFFDARTFARTCLFSVRCCFLLYGGASIWLFARTGQTGLYVVICTHSGGCFGLCAHMAKLAWMPTFASMRAQALGFARTPDFSGQCCHLLPIGMRDRLHELSVFEADTAFYCHGCSTELRLRIFALTSSKWARCYLLPSRVRFQIEPFEGACTGLGCALSVPCTGQYRYRAGLGPCPYRCCTVGAPVSNGARTAKQRQSNSFRGDSRIARVAVQATALHVMGCHRALHPCKPNTLYSIGLLG